MRRLPAPVHLAPLKKGSFVSVAAWIGASLVLFAGVWQQFVVATGFLWFVIPAVAAAAVWWDLKGKSRAGIQSLGGMITPLLFVLSVLGAASGLYGAWRSGFVVDWFSAGPLLPFSDAGEYVNGAKSLITFGELGEISARRPLGTTLIAVALWITNQNYQLSLILLALLTGVTTFFAVRQTFLAGGLLAALLYLGLCLLVLSEWVPLFGTETTGYLFASLSYAVLLSAFRRRSFNESLIGLALLILAQAARPGAILAIPTVGGYLIYFFSTTWRGALRKGMIVAALVTALLLMDRLVSIKIGPPHLEYQGNVSYSLYGLAAGDKSWTYVLAEHPEINQIVSDGERSRYVYGLFWRRLIAHPEVFASVIVKRFWLTIQDLASVYFGLVKHIPLALVSTVGLIGFVLLFRPAIRCASTWAFLPAAAIGTFLSAPFLFDAGSRIYMSIVSFHLALTDRKSVV